MRSLCVVTGALGYSGRHVTRALLAAGHPVRTITGHPERTHPFGQRIDIRRWYPGEPARIRASLEGAGVLVNTFWVRFDWGDTTYQRAISQSLELFEAAVTAGVERIVHVSITQPSLDSSLPYFRGKARLEAAVRSTGCSYAIVRPAVLFGGRDVLLNNIAWLLRRLPVFGIPGSGRYRLQPVHVDDLAELVVELASRRDSVVLDAVGPEIFEYRELVSIIARAVRSRALVLSLPPSWVVGAAKLLGLLLRDVILTRDEVAGLMADLLVSDAAPTGRTRLSDWLASHGGELGRQYASELARHYR